MGKSVVSVVKTDRTPDEDGVRAAVRRAVEMAGGLPVKLGQRVLVKPNLVRPNSDVRNGMTTSVEVCKAVADLVREAGAQAIIAESSSVGNDTEAAFQQAGYIPLREQGYGIIDLKGTPVVRRETPEGQVFDHLSVFALATQVDAVISVPVMKTHDGLEVTLALKNLKGLIPDKI